MLCFLKISFPSRSFEEAMCIMFVYIDNSPPEEGYRLVVTNNRDERFNKPTKPADFWQDDPNCISGKYKFIKICCNLSHIPVLNVQVYLSLG